MVIGGSVVVPVDLTSPWIPLSIIMLLGVFMVRQFMQERRDARALAFAEAQAGPAAAEPAPAAAPVAVEKPAKKKMKLRWRTAWIWLPFLIGFVGQAYLSFIKPMVDSAG
ncbi:hypothetical protein [Parvibaculum sp.]|uniref:hypothetical protein n=1 Tax=Parvibaculum sp. TaxID=2024848 RepID=UPI0027314796|nr:hypothetical protein [Parvibaculum sp.]MDP1628041.1 hypothetical protein [Parvibaculum sp.]MDP2151040.1 hypothetical protein [Parvibaculum sp.]MDP3328507.1 hypothetical protein [Parvibaculum sp.]